MFCTGYCLKFIAFVMLLLCVRIFYTKKKDAVLLYVDGSCLSFLARTDQIVSNGLEIFIVLFFSSKHRIPNQPNSTKSSIFPLKHSFFLVGSGLQADRLNLRSCLAATAGPYPPLRPKCPVLPWKNLEHHHTFCSQIGRVSHVFNKVLADVSHLKRTR